MNVSENLEVAPADYVSADSNSQTMNPVFTSSLDLIRNPIPEEITAPSAPTPSSMMQVKSAWQWCVDSARRPDPRPLWLSLWHEGEICCLFADSNLGKSIYAVEIAAHIARSEKVIYFDFELSDKQFQLRYTDEFGNLHKFSPNLLRAEINSDTLFDEIKDIEDRIIADIEALALAYGTNKIIIDNLSFLCNASDKSDMAGKLMLRLIELKRRLGLSILVLAHTPKRSLSSAITQNDLAGSKKLFNFFDSAFAIGKSAKDPALRYIKQLKVRAGAFEYGAENVIVAEIVKDNDWLHFATMGYASEQEHLKSREESDKETMANNVMNFHKEGKSMREIASLCGISLSSVHRIVKKAQ